MAALFSSGCTDAQMGELRIVGAGAANIAFFEETLAQRRLSEPCIFPPTLFNLWFY